MCKNVNVSFPDKMPVTVFSLRAAVVLPQFDIYCDSSNRQYREVMSVLRYAALLLWLSLGLSRELVDLLESQGGERELCGAVVGSWLTESSATGTSLGPRLPIIIILTLRLDLLIWRTNSNEAAFLLWQASVSLDAVLSVCWAALAVIHLGSSIVCEKVSMYKWHNSSPSGPEWCPFSELGHWNCHNKEKIKHYCSPYRN